MAEFWARGERNWARIEYEASREYKRTPAMLELIRRNEAEQMIELQNKKTPNATNVKKRALVGTEEEAKEVGKENVGAWFNKKIKKDAKLSVKMGKQKTLPGIWK